MECRISEWIHSLVSDSLQQLNKALARAKFRERKSMQKENNCNSVTFIYAYIILQFSKVWYSFCTIFKKKNIQSTFTSNCCINKVNNISNSSYDKAIPSKWRLKLKIARETSDYNTLILAPKKKQPHYANARITSRIGFCRKRINNYLLIFRSIASCRRAGYPPIEFLGQRYPADIGATSLDSSSSCAADESTRWYSGYEYVDKARCLWCDAMSFNLCVPQLILMAEASGCEGSIAVQRFVDFCLVSAVFIVIKLSWVRINDI